MDAGLAHDAAEPHRRAPGRGRSRPGGTLRGVRRQRCGWRRDPDLHRRHRVRDRGVRRDGCAGGPLCRGQRTRQGKSDGLSGFPCRGGVVGTAAGPAGVGAGAVAAPGSERRARRTGRSVAVPPHHVRGQPRDVALVHGERGGAGGGRRAQAAASGRAAHRSEHRVQRGVHHWPRTLPALGHRRRRGRHHSRGHRGERHRGIPVVFGAPPGDLAPRHELAARLGHHPRAVSLRAAHRRSGNRDEHRGRAAAPFHRLAGGERAGTGRLRGGLHGALLLHHVDVGGVDERRCDRRRSEPGSWPSRARGARRARGGGARPRPGGRYRDPVRLDPALPARRVRYDRPRGRRAGRPVTPLPERFGAVRHRRPHVHGGTPGHGRHALAALHLDRVPDRGAARSLHPVPGDARPAPRRHLDGHPAGAHHPLRVERTAVPPGEVARHQSRGCSPRGEMMVGGPKATRRDWIGLAVIALPCLLYSMDLTVLNLAVPKLSEALKPSSAQLLWIVDIYGFLIAGSLITMGTLGDRIGRRRLLLIGAAAFGVASVIAAFSTTAEMLIATRALLGVAGATLAPSTLSLIRSMFLDPQQRTVAIGVWVTSYSVGGAIGPLLGGVLLQYFWWGSVFLIGVPVMLLLLVLGPILLPEFRDPQAGRLDLFSAALSLAAVLLVIYGLKRVAEHGLGWVPAFTIVTGLAVGAAFLRRQRALAHPLIDLRLFRSRAFSASLAVYLLGTLVAFGAYIYIAQYLQLVLGLPPLQAGLATVPSMAAFVVGSMLVPVIARRVRPWSLMAAGLVLAAVGFGVLAQAGGAGGAGGLEVIVIGSIIYSLGFSPVVILATDLIVGGGSGGRRGAAA